MGVICRSSSREGIAVFFRRDSRTRGGRVPVVVVMVGLNDAPNGAVADLGEFDGGDTSSCGNAVSSIRYSERHGAVRVNGGEFAQCTDGRTMLVLADARRLGEARCVPIDAVAPPPIERPTRLGTIARLVGFLITRSKRFEVPSAKWFDELAGHPEILAFVSTSQGLVTAA